MASLPWKFVPSIPLCEGQSTHFPWQFTDIQRACSLHTIKAQSVKWFSKITQISQTHLMKAVMCNVRKLYRRNENDTCLALSEIVNLSHKWPTNMFSFLHITNTKVGCMNKFLLVWKVWNTESVASSLTWHLSWNNCTYIVDHIHMQIPLELDHPEHNNC